MPRAHADHHLDLGEEILMDTALDTALDTLMDTLKETQKRRLAFLLVLILAALGVKVMLVRSEARKLMAREIPTSIGMADSVKAMVVKLEADLAERAAYEPPESQDPLALRKVLRIAARSPSGDETAEGGRMRLSATMLSPGRFLAIIKYKGESHTLAIGDSLDHRVVKSIDKRTVVLEYQGKSLMLVNEPAPRAEVQTEGSAGVRRGRLEDIEL
jgi:type II secretory pathway component PulC